jgi:hypothetical protein
VDRPQLQWRNIEKCQKPFIFFFSSSSTSYFTLHSRSLLTYSACWLPSSSSSTNVYLYCLFSFSFFKFLFTQYFFKKNFLLYFISFSWGSKKIQTHDTFFLLMLLLLFTSSRSCGRRIKDFLLHLSFSFNLYIYVYMLNALSIWHEERKRRRKKNCSSFPFHIK